MVKRTNTDPRIEVLSRGRNIRLYCRTGKIGVVEKVEDLISQDSEERDCFGRNAKKIIVRATDRKLYNKISPLVARRIECMNLPKDLYAIVYKDYNLGDYFP